MKRFGGFDESYAIENFIRLEDGFWYKIFFITVYLTLFVTSGCYWNSTCSRKLELSNASRKRPLKVVS